MKNLKKIIGMLMVMVMVLSLAACGGDTEESTEVKSSDKNTEEATETSKDDTDKEEVKEEAKPIEFKIMLASADETRKAINEKIISGLEETFPGVEFEVDEASDYVDKARTMNATGDLPDVFFLDSREFQLPLINAGSVLDLKPHIEADGFADKYKLKTVIAPHSDGGIYSLQSGADAYFAATLFYNKDMFAEFDLEVPVTFDEFVGVCDVLKENGKTPITTSLSDAWAAKSLILPSLIAAEDPDTIERIKSLDINFATDPVVVAAMEKLSILGTSGYFHEGFLNTDYGTAQGLFTNKEAGMYMMFSWAAGDLAVDPSFGIMSWPQANPDVNMDEVVTLWGSSYSGYLVNSEPVDVDLAVKVAEYCAMTEAVYFNEVSKMPTSLDTGVVIEDVSELVQENLDRINNATIALPSYILYSFSSKGNTKQSELMSEVLIGAETVEGFSERFAPDWAESVEELKNN